MTNAANRYERLLERIRKNATANRLRDLEVVEAQCHRESPRTIKQTIDSELDIIRCRRIKCCGICGCGLGKRSMSNRPRYRPSGKEAHVGLEQQRRSDIIERAKDI